MIIQIDRYADDGEATLGLLSIDGDFFCYTLEDTKRKTKVEGKTRIPPGVYPLAFREVLSPLTKDYREQYEFFSYHIELQRVTNFDHVYIHIGNYHTDTQGCILLGSGATDFPRRMVTNSTQAYKSFYARVKDQVSKGVAKLKIYGG